VCNRVIVRHKTIHCQTASIYHLLLQT